MGVECVSVPSSADHLIFCPVLRSNASGRRCSFEIILRDHASPHCGWSAANAISTAKMTENINQSETNGRIELLNGRFPDGEAFLVRSFLCSNLFPIVPSASSRMFLLAGADVL